MKGTPCQEEEEEEEEAELIIVPAGDGTRSRGDGGRRRYPQYDGPVYTQEPAETESELDAIPFCRYSRQ
ncbi:MAG: hypothetical protein KAR44_01760 [Candidatus Aegiribacteria sp.]|nr:hypothetical protein [Candidatus Aegiribacteria sp.]